MTEVPWIYKGPLLGTEESFFLLGSCFSEEFARHLGQSGEKFFQNPFGTLYDPLSMARCLDILESEDWSPKDEMFFHRGLWRHPELHTLAAHPEAAGASSEIQKRQRAGGQAWLTATTAVFTFGTAYSYFHRTTGRGWSNCHTLPGKEFRRVLGSPEEMTLVWTPLLQRMKARGTKVFFTLSPVRHLRDAPWENSLSKATLRVFIHQLENQGLGTYFPAYEILLDELRDYRWYADDLVHPSPQAGEYISGKFWEAAAGGEVKKRSEAWRALKKELNHRPRHPDSPEEKERQKQLSLRRDRLLRNYPGWTPGPPLPGLKDARGIES